MYLGLIVALLVVTAAGSLTLGSNNLPVSEVLNGLLHGGTSDAAVIVRELRVPRTLIGLAVGASLGLAGALMQAITRNPLADPGLLGVEAGAAAAVVSAIALLGLRTPGTYLWFGLAGAAATSLLVYAVGSGSRRSGADPIRLVLAGAAISAVLAAYVEGVMLTKPRSFEQFRSWHFGTIAGRDVGQLLVIGPVLLAGAVIALALSRRLNAMALGEDAGRALGVNLHRTRLLGALSITLLCGAATALAGPIGFIGLAVPYAARLFMGVDQRWILLTSMPLGAALVLFCDTAGRVIGRPGEISVGIVTAAIGGPLFIALVRRRRIPHL